MKIRVPWIRSRRRLFTAVLLETVLFITLNKIFDLHGLADWTDESIIMPILWATWVLSSYVLGRYQLIDRFRAPAGSLPIVQQAVKTILVAAMSLLGTLSYQWLLKSDAGEPIFHSNFIPYLGSLALMSLLNQTILNKWISNNLDNTNHWEFLGTKEVYKRLLHHLKWSRLPANLTYLARENINASDRKAIIVNDISSEPSSIINDLLRLQQQGCIVITKQEWCELVLQRFPSEFLSDGDLLHLEFTLPQGSFQSRLKRLGDIALSTLLLLLSSPLLIVVGLLIKIEDGGPVFYSQTRSGLNGIPYTLWKIRSMKIDSEPNGAQWMNSKDSRITNIGSLLRISRMDEMPQLLCVIAGKMSLIGPRPERPEFDQELEKNIRHYRLRQRIRPGLSGWAQVNYHYGASVEDSANKLSYDLYYLRNFSFWLDLLILFKTIRLVFNRKGALPDGRHK